MKIKFIKEYRALVGEALSGSATCAVGTVVDTTEKSAQWLIDNGFAEEVEESQQLFSDASLDKNVSIVNVIFERSQVDDGTAQEFVDYLNAVNTVIQDEGIMADCRINGYVWEIVMGDDGGLDVTTTKPTAGSLYFEWSDDAWTSIRKHPDEWKTIAKYKWGK